MPLHRENLSSACPIFFVNADTWPQVSSQLSEFQSAFAKACGFEPSPGQTFILPDEKGAVGAVLFGLEKKAARSKDLFLPGRLATTLPAKLYRFANEPHDASLGALAFLLAGYKYSRYKAVNHDGPELCAPEGVDADRIDKIAEAVSFGRDLINTPANDLGPDALETAALNLSNFFKAKASVIRGDKLLHMNHPLIHAVGRASDKAPRLIEFNWGSPADPKVTLVGKGVCFDSGGLDIKPSSAMGLMKKDMGGAATALALAHMIMAANLKVRLRVLIPAVENSISANAFRPGDIFPSRKGLSVEIGNTDAEGRLILADALALADEESPELLLDFATLTGAARVALGPDLPPFYTMDDELAAEIFSHGMEANDPVWRLPLWDPYDKLLDGKISDLNNISSGSFAGSITAALFLRRFVEKARSWVHFDIYAWVPSAKSGRPEGGEVQVSRLLFDLIEKRYGKAARMELTEKPRKIVRRPDMKVPGPVEDEGSIFDDITN